MRLCLKKSFKLWSFKALMPPRLQFFTNSCRFFLVLFCAGFPPHLLPFTSPARMFRLSSGRVLWPLAISLPLLACSLFLFLYLSFYFVRCRIFAVCVFFLPSWYVFVFHLARSSSSTCLYRALLRSAQNVG